MRHRNIHSRFLGPLGGEPGEGSLGYAFEETTTPYKGTNNATYTVVAIVPFPGTDNWLVPSVVRASVHRSGGESMDIRLWRVDTAQVVAEALGIVVTIPTLTDLGAVANLPTGPGDIEVQARRNGGGGNARVSNLLFDP